MYENKYALFIRIYGTILEKLSSSNKDGSIFLFKYFIT